MVAGFVESIVCGTLRLAFFDRKTRIDPREAKTAFTPRSCAYRLAASSTVVPFSSVQFSESIAASVAYASFVRIFI